MMSIKRGNKIKYHINTDKLIIKKTFLIDKHSESILNQMSESDVKTRINGVTHGIFLI